MTDKQVGIDDVRAERIRRFAAQRSADHIIDVLRRFIPDACLMEARNEVTKALYMGGNEITSVQERLQLEIIKNRMINISDRDIFRLTPTPPDTKE